jgi:hypothetical protein
MVMQNTSTPFPAITGLSEALNPKGRGLMLVSLIFTNDQRSKHCDALSMVDDNDRTSKVEMPLPEEHRRPPPDEFEGTPCDGHFWRPG